MPAQAKATISFIAPTSLGMSVTLDFGTEKLSFYESDSIDAGSYLGEFVHQHCRLVRIGAWTVFFRPDANGTRDEVVVEYGGWPTPAGATPSHILTPFTATISRDGTVLAMVSVPKQFWMTRWRWQSAARPIVRKAADLYALRALLPLSERALIGTVPNYRILTAIWNGPMSTAALLTGMGATGDRQEIGPITNLQASYLMRNNAEALTGLLAQAEAVGSFPFWLRDDSGSLIDVYKHPYIGFTATADGARHPQIYPAFPRGSDGKVMPDFFQLNLAHFPSVAFVPWLLTDDPYFLEGIQATAIYAAIEHNYHQINKKLPGLANPPVPRAWAWGLREIIRMAAFAPETTPSWLQPRSYFRKMADDNLTYAKMHMASKTKATRVFHMATGNNGFFCSWQESYLGNILGWMRWSGFFPEWNEAVDWFAEPFLRLTAPDSEGGWNRRWPVPYYAAVGNARIDATVRSSNSASTNPPVEIDFYEKTQTAAELARVAAIEANTPDDWGELWRLFQAGRTSIGFPIVVGPDDKIYEQPIDNKVSSPSGPHYHELLTGALASLAMGGVPNALEHWQWMSSKMPAIYARGAYGGATRSFRYAITVE